MNEHLAPATISGCLITTPLWAEQLLHVLNATMTTVSVTTGAFIGVITLYRMLRGKKKD
jgi:cytochrome bd-type quinol oxidase subunit 1